MIFKVYFGKMFKIIHEIGKKRGIIICFPLFTLFMDIFIHQFTILVINVNKEASRIYAELNSDIFFHVKSH